MEKLLYFLPIKIEQLIQIKLFIIIIWIQEKQLEQVVVTLGIFEPTQYKNEYLIDGGIRENVPWKILKENGADKVISIVFENELVEKEKINIFDGISGSLELLCHELSTYELEGADYLLKIKTKDVSLLDKSKINYLYQLGYIEMKGKIKEIKKLINE